MLELIICGLIFCVIGIIFPFLSLFAHGKDTISIGLFLLWTGLIMGEAGGIMVVIGAIAMDETGYFLYGLLLTAIFSFIIMMIIKSKIDNKREAAIVLAELRKAEETRQAEHKAFIDSLDNDTFEFNCLEYYNRCIGNGISNFDDTFSKSKANLIVDQILKEQNVPETYWDRYHKRSNDLFLEGQKTSDFIK